MLPIGQQDPGWRMESGPSVLRGTYSQMSFGSDPLIEAISISLGHRDVKTMHACYRHWSLYKMDY